jgi:secondary thiamine-phosphate synthase enzyme
MAWYSKEIKVQTNGKGLYEVTNLVEVALKLSKIKIGMLHLFVKHTSASFCISENADPTAKKDIEYFFEKIAPEAEPWHQHTLEGYDDSPSHIRSILTHTSESTPIIGGRLSLGTWQGLYLFEHRRQPHQRTIALQFNGDL